MWLKRYFSSPLMMSFIIRTDEKQTLISFYKRLLLLPRFLRAPFAAGRKLLENRRLDRMFAVYPTLLNISFSSIRSLQFAPRRSVPFWLPWERRRRELAHEIRACGGREGRIK